MTALQRLNKRPDYLLWFSRIFVGVLFIFSGLIKANDPLGFGYKLQEYFEVFHTTFLNDYSVELSIFICALEMIFGAALLLGYKAKQISWGLLLLIIFFTFLTFWSAAFDVVKTCGCFGDAIPLTPWQSFGKDLILLVFILVVFVKRKRIYPVFGDQAMNVLLLIVVLLSFGSGIYTYNFLPVIDFLPYHKGANLPAYMRVPPGAPQDVYEINYTLKNKKTGETKKMTDKEYLKTEIWKDANWEITGEPENKLIKLGYQAKIKDLRISDSQGTDYTSEIIENPYYNLVIVAYDLNKANEKAIGDLNAITINAAENYNIRTVLLTSASAELAGEFSKKHNLIMETFYADAVPLKSMVRANPGLLLLKNGEVIDKWHFHSLPSYQELETQYFRHNQ
ncbi:putative membrane protein YphA (DoxX/SURF4 family) [Arcticibacter tournemirensis]|uniref:DoxX family protein n=1 Tax=Arcticibacter tournemirensis TaxID=699437 RepID=A0A5M9HI80_9SPHI|nr:BT_3928 family protein [Arcticibacter tournemirensis]KAA8486732.1 DoxX family protein [Arcticibacter tournemirensis]TQM49272.1 putative membrane protein YphA (DoxX/SURF4 family) [Arcticibacter tournemirensis]